MELFTRYFRFPEKGTDKELVVTLVGDMNRNFDGTYTVRFGAARCTTKDNFVKATGRTLAMNRYGVCPMEMRMFPSSLTIMHFGYAAGIKAILEDIAFGICCHPQYIEHFKAKKDCPGELRGYVLVDWPHSQTFMEEPWFQDEAILHPDISAAYFIPLNRISANKTII